MEMEMDSELELLLIPSITPKEQESSHLIEDLTHKEMETHSLLDSKISLLKTTDTEEKILALKDKSQTREVETTSELEPQLMPQITHLDQKL